MSVNQMLIYRLDLLKYNPMYISRWNSRNGTTPEHWYKWIWSQFKTVIFVYLADKNNWSRIKINTHTHLGR